MSAGKPIFIRNTVIEEVTAGRIREYEAKAAVVVKFPVPIEKIIEQVLGLSLWTARFDFKCVQQLWGQPSQLIEFRF